MPRTILALKPRFEDVLAEIEGIQEKKHVKHDYHAFVYWFIATLYGQEEISIKRALCDGTHDKGVDAVLIDKRERTVSVFQSKFERAGNNTQLNENEVKLLAIVRDYFKSRKALVAATHKANPATQHLLEEAFQAVSNGFSLELVFITTHKANPAVEPLVRNTLHFTQDQFRVFCYDNILAIMADKSRDFLPANRPYNLPFKSEDGEIVRPGSHKSWVLTVSANALRDMAISYPDHLLFRKNVKDFLGTGSETNRRMKETLIDPIEQKNFWFYNNGITVLCTDAAINMEQKFIHLLDPEIINGCQTVTTIRRFKEDSNSEVLVRVVASEDQAFMDSMILYQNSSNPVLKRDLKSNDPVQVRLHHEFFKRGWFYEIKRGKDFSTIAKEDTNIRDQCIRGGISNSEVAKYLAAVSIHPSAGSKGDDYFFGEAYEDIFTSELSTYNCLAPLMLKWEIYQSYNSAKFHGFEKEWVFKKPATYFVLKVLFDCLARLPDAQKAWVTFWENIEEDSKEWKTFKSQINQVIGSLFEVAYKGWRNASKTSEIDHNGFFKKQDEVDKILGSEETLSLQKEAQKIIEQAIKTDTFVQ